MEQRGVILGGIARVLNAGGCALLNIYDAATSIKIKTSVLPGEKGSLQSQLAESEKRIEKIKQRITAMEEEEKAAREAAIKSAETKAEPAADAGEPAASEAPVAGEASPGAVTEENTATEALEKMLKDDLLKLCLEKGIEADKRMTKAGIIELILKR